MADMDLLRRWSGADQDEDPAVLEHCYRSAVEWYSESGVPETTAGPLYQTWVMNLAAWFYDNRGTADPIAHIPAYIVESLHQLRPRRPRKRRCRR